MQVETLESIKQQIVTLTPQELNELSYFVSTQQEIKCPTTNDQSADKSLISNKRLLQAEWMKAHRQEYGGLYVALDGDRLLGTGRNYSEAAAAARQAGLPNAFIDVVLPFDYEGYLGA